MVHTHNLLTHNLLTHNLRTHNLLTHNLLTHTQLAHTQLTHTQLTHTQLVYTQLVHTQLTHTQLAHIQRTHAGVALGDMDRHFAWQAWHVWHWAGSGGALGSHVPPWSPRLFAWQAWQAWHLATCSCTLRGRRGTLRHPPAFAKEKLVSLLLDCFFCDISSLPSSPPPFSPGLWLVEGQGDRDAEDDVLVGPPYAQWERTADNLWMGYASIFNL